MDSANCRSKTIFLICSWESTGGKHRLYALFYAILNKGFEHVLSLVSVKGLGNNPPWILMDYWSFGGVKNYTQIFEYARVVIPNSPYYSRVNRICIGMCRWVYICVCAFCIYMHIYYIMFTCKHIFVCCLIKLYKIFPQCFAMLNP